MEYLLEWLCRVAWQGQRGVAWEGVLAVVGRLDGWWWFHWMHGWMVGWQWFRLAFAFSLNVKVSARASHKHPNTSIQIDDALVHFSPVFVQPPSPSSAAPKKPVRKLVIHVSLNNRLCVAHSVTGSTYNLSIHPPTQPSKGRPSIVHRHR